MRRLTLILLLLALLAGGLHAQEEEDDTLADSLTDFPLFYDLLAADDDVLALLEDPAAQLTVFTPTDTAITRTLAALDLSLDDLRDDPDVLASVLRHHIIPAAYTQATLRENDLTYIMTALDERGLAIQVVGDDLFVNAVPVLPGTLTAANGYLHPVDELLIPPARLAEPDTAPETPDMTLLEILAEREEFSRFNTLLADADPALREQLATAGPFVLIVPTDDAFAISEDMADTSANTRLLAYHILPGQVSAGTIATALPLLGDAPFNVLTLTGLPVTFTQDAADHLLVNDEIITTTDIYATNGVIHVIETPLDPLEALPQAPGV
jgi:transforming growth factor-beta-induced protein